MQLKFPVFLLVVCIVILSCDRTLMKEKRQEIDKIDLKGLLDTLNSEVASANPLLFKRARIDKQIDSSELHLTKEEWEKELNSFSDLKIRPGRLLTEFEEKINSTDSTRHYRYYVKNPRKEPLDSLFILTDSQDKLLSLKAYKNDRNAFSSSQEILLLHFFSYENESQLPVSYHISGWQKIRTKDTISYQIEGELTY